MTMQSEITGVERIEIDGKAAALIKCDVQAARERAYFAHDNSDDWNSNIKLTDYVDGSYVQFICDEPAGLYAGQWVIYASAMHDGVIVTKRECEEDFYSPIEAIDMENEWIDVLMIVRNFFALDRSETWDFERFI